MSFIVDTGVRFRDPAPAAIEAMRQRLLPAMQAAVRTEVAGLLASMAGDGLDWAASGHDPASAARGHVTAALATRPMATAWNEYLRRVREIQATRHRDPEVDFEFIVWLIPSEAGLLGFFRTERDTLERLFRADPNVESWGYWDNCDRDEDVSVEEWAYRRKVWDHVARQDPQRRGNVTRVAQEKMDLINLDESHLYLPAPDQVLAAMPSFERRLSRRALHEATRLLAEEAAGPGVQPSFDQMWQAMMACSASDHPMRLATEARLREMLPRQITLAMLHDGWEARSAACTEPHAEAHADGIADGAAPEAAPARQLPAAAPGTPRPRGR